MTGKTLKELNVQPGDVVEYLPGKGVTTVTEIRDGLYYGTGSNGDNPYTDRAAFRLISRACDAPKTWGDMTDAEKGALMLAAHEGKVIECLEGDISQSFWITDSPPEWISSYAYRVRPEPKRETVTLYGNVKSNLWTASRSDIDRHRITFDMIDGEPEGTAKIERLT